jgi:hypothetical protein
MTKKQRRSGVCDYIRSGNVLIPVCLMTHDEYMRFIDAYADGDIKVITLR